MRGTFLSNYKEVEAVNIPLIRYCSGYYFYTLCVP